MRAIDELKAAAGSRPFVLVIEKAHRLGPKTNVAIYATDSTATWEVLGLLREGQIRAECSYTAPPEDAAP